MTTGIAAAAAGISAPSQPFRPSFVIKDEIVAALFDMGFTRGAILHTLYARRTSELDQLATGRQSVGGLGFDTPSLFYPRSCLFF